MSLMSENRSVAPQSGGVPSCLGFVGLLLLSGLGVACAGGPHEETAAEESATSSAPVMNGYPLYVNDPVGVARFLKADGTTACSGVLLNNSFVLTAKHCEYFQNQRVRLLNSSEVRHVACASDYPSDPFPGLDVSLIMLDEPFSGNHDTKLYWQNPETLVGNNLRCYGWGNYGGEDDTLSYGDMPMLGLGSSPRNYSEIILDGPYVGDIWGSAIEHRFVMWGDSGGPCMYQDADANQYLVGVISSYTTVNYGPPYTSRIVPLSEFRDWAIPQMYVPPVDFGAGPFDSGVAAVSIKPGRVDLVATKDGLVYWKATQDNQVVQDWTGVPFGLTPHAPAIVRNSDSSFTIYMTRSNGHVYRISYSLGMGWSPSWPTLVSSATSCLSGPSVARVLSGSGPEIFCTVANGNPGTLGVFYDSTTPSWTTYSIPTNSDPFVLSRGFGIDSFASYSSGTARLLNHRYRPHRGGWGSWAPLSPPGPYTAVGGASFRSSRMDLFGSRQPASDGGHLLGHLSYEGGWMSDGAQRSWDNLQWDYGGPLIQASYDFKPAAASAASGNLDVFYVDHATSNMKKVHYPASVCDTGRSFGTRPPAIRNLQ